MAADPRNSGTQIHQTPAWAREPTGQCVEGNLGGKDCVNFGPDDAAQKTAIDTLKIDQSFILTITSNRDDASIVCAVIGMGMNLHMRVVAEGIETHEQLAFLQNRECTIGQGHYFSEPLPGRECTQLLRCGIPVQELQLQPD